MGKAVVNEYQPSMTEWFAAIGEEKESIAFREEDNQKVQKLEQLYETIGLIYERPIKWAAHDLFDRSPAFEKYLQDHRDELCAIRLVPNRDELPKLRNRGLTVKDCYETWLLKQDVNPDDYTAYICPHTDKLLWSGIFVVNEDMIFGEFIRGMHSQLTQGETIDETYRFQFDFKGWRWSARDSEVEREVKRAVAAIYVPDKGRQKELEDKLNARFVHDYLYGYFETTVWPDDTLYFIDYNRMLPKYFKAPPSPETSTNGDKATIKGSPACSGTAQGTVVIVTEQNLSSVDFPEGAILVCDNTDVRFLPLMKKAAAIVTNRDGTLSHAAIVARELNKPCLVGTKDATTKLKIGDHVTVNATAGTLTKE